MITISRLYTYSLLASLCRRLLMATQFFVNACGNYQLLIWRKKTFEK